MIGAYQHNNRLEIKHDISQRTTDDFLLELDDFVNAVVDELALGLDHVVALAGRLVEEAAVQLSAECE